MLLQIAWKNIWRNKVRSIVILSAIALGIFAGMFNMAFYYGMVEQRIETAIKTEASHIQIHNKEYLTDPDIRLYMSNGSEMTGCIKKLPYVKEASKRTIVNAMIASAETGSGVRIVGIDPDIEKKVTDIHQRLVTGEYLEGIRRNPIVIGEKLAEKLNVKVRSKVVITLQNVNGEMMYVSFRVAGIFKTSNTVYDESTVFVKNDDISGLLALTNDDIHEIAVLLKSNEGIDQTLADIRNKYPDRDVKTWAEILPEVGLVEESMNLSMFIFMGIILFALLFGIINTMLMAVLERRKELGMLMAVGMNKLRVFTMIMFETIMLSLSGGIVGILIGVGFTLLFSNRGIDLSTWGKAYEYMGYDTIVYPILNLDMSFQVVIMVIITGFLASLYPARKALKLNPAEAIRIDI
ncbi:MAG: ABC transporter permease [Bacteroidales bacterium]|nr:ABC transporter permease [Bacteroidales bacterium]